MSAEIRVLTGARAGTVLPVSLDTVFGRLADTDLQFDPQHDLEVSGRHAELRFRDGRWVLRDLGSRNGTFVNGERIQEQPLRDGDRIMFGWQGPQAEFRLTDDAVADHAGLGETRQSRVLVSRADLHRQNSRLRWIAGGLAVALVAAIAAMFAFQRQRAIRSQAETAALLTRIDSALAASDSMARRMAGERDGIMDALRSSQQEVRRVRTELQSAGNGNDAGAADLRRQLQTAMAALLRQQLAASLDFAAIERRARHAVAMVWVEYDDGSVATGTAFAVRPDATLITSRHVLTGPDRQAGPRRIAVQFSDSEQVWPARLLRIADDADIAAIRIDNIVGDVPVVPPLDTRPDTLLAGSPVAMIGFPLGGATWPGRSRSRMAAPLTTAGIITAASSIVIEVQGYGAAGASGSPIFNGEGNVVAVVYGGRGEASAQVLFGVPASAVKRLLDGLQ